MTISIFREARRCKQGLGAILVFVIHLIYHRCDSLYITTSEVELELALKRASKIIWSSGDLLHCTRSTFGHHLINHTAGRSIASFSAALSLHCPGVIIFCPTYLIRPFTQAGIYCDLYGISKRDRLLPMFILLLWNNHCLRPLSHPKIDEVARLASGLDPNLALYCKKVEWVY